MKHPLFWAEVKKVLAKHATRILLNLYFHHNPNLPHNCFKHAFFSFVTLALSNKSVCVCVPPPFHIGSLFIAKLKILLCNFFLYEKKVMKVSPPPAQQFFVARCVFYMKRAVSNLQGKREETILTFCEGLYFALRQLHFGNKHAIFDLLSVILFFFFIFLD